jgi:hypothetical protein
VRRKALRHRNRTQYFSAGSPNSVAKLGCERSGLGSSGAIPCAACTTVTVGSEADFQLSVDQSTGSDVTVNYEFAEGPNSQCLSYTAASAVIPATGGNTTATISISSWDDGSESNDDYLWVQVTNASDSGGDSFNASATASASIQGGSSSGTSVPVVSISGPATVNLGSTAGFQFSLSALPPQNLDVTVNYQFAEGPSLSSASLTSASVIIPSGNLTASISVTPWDDGLYESNDDYLWVLVSGASDSAGDSFNASSATASTLIQGGGSGSGSSVPVVSVSGPTTVTLGGTAYFPVTLSLPEPTSNTVTVFYQVAESQSSASLDFGSTTLSAFFVSGATTGSIAVNPWFDGNEGNDDYLYVQLTGASDGTSNTMTTAGMISASIVPPIDGLAVTTNSGNLASLTANVNLVNTPFAVTVDWGNGQSTETYSFPASAQNPDPIQINYLYPGTNPGNAPTYVYSVTASLAAADVYAISGATATCQTVAPTVVVGTPTVTIAETDPGQQVTSGSPANFVVQLSGTILTPLTVYYTATDLTTITYMDYTALASGGAAFFGPQALTFQPGGSDSRTITMRTFQDASATTDRTFEVTLSTPTTTDVVTSVPATATVVTSTIHYVVNSTGYKDAADPSVSPWTGGYNAIGAKENTLRSFIEYLNATGGGDIDFNIPTEDPGYQNSVYTIQEGDLPDVEVPTVIDGATQPGYPLSGGNPVIVVAGRDGPTGDNGNGLTLSACKSEIVALDVGNFNGSGIVLNGVHDDRVDDCNIGVERVNLVVNGVTTVVTQAIRNSQNGIDAERSATNWLIDNVIAKNMQSGILFQGSGMTYTDATYNVVTGNFIGTDAAGTAGLGNLGDGIAITSGAQDNMIGGSGKGNVISGNQGDGVFMDASSDNYVVGNWIGTNQSDSTAIANVGDGIAITDGSQYNWIGGTSFTWQGGTSSEPDNVIAKNGVSGVLIDGSNYNFLAQNWIGTDVSGSTTIGNTGDGVTIMDRAQKNTIGGYGGGPGSVIAKNGGNGVTITGSGTNSNIVAANFIGTNGGGTVALPNAGDGVAISSGAQLNTIGGTVTAARNIISGNNGNGVSINGSQSTGNEIQGDYIGVRIDGMAALPNGANGVYVTGQANWNFIGVNGIDSPSGGNVISGNTDNGVLIFAGSHNNFVSGDLIGVGADGQTRVANGGTSQNTAGVLIAGGAQSNVIGTNSDGIADAAEANVISGNTGCGVWISGSNTNDNRVSGNMIGTVKDGSLPLGNNYYGVNINLGASKNLIGVNSSAYAAQDGANTIAGNVHSGVSVEGNGTQGNVVAGNYIGTNAAFSANLGNGQDGVVIDIGAQSNVIGVNTTFGSEAAIQGNVISGNGEDGIEISDNGTNANVVAGNHIGTGAGGTSPLGNGQGGIRIESSASGNIIGSNPLAATVDPLAGNTIAFNGNSPAAGQTGAGIAVGSSLADLAVGNSILGNTIFLNHGIGIDLGDDGPTPNNPANCGSGPNNLQTEPTIDNYFISGTGAGASTQITGTLIVAQGGQFRIELFANNSSERDWYDEGNTLIADFTQASQQINGTWSVTFNQTVSGSWQNITATATGLYNGTYNTSEFGSFRSAIVQAVTYSANSSTAIHTITPDPTPGNLSPAAYAPTNQWQINGSGVLVHDYPLCYTRSGAATGAVVDMTTTVTIQLQGNPGNNFQVCATGSSLEAPYYVCKLSEQAGTSPSFNSTTDVLTAYLQSNALPSTIAQFPLTLSWQVSVDGAQTWVSAGQTTNRSYLTWSNPVNTGPLFESYLAIGCPAASTSTIASNDDVVNAVYTNGFMTLNVHNMAGTKMTYAHFNGIARTARKLLATGTGQCDAWADLLVQTLAAQGISSASATIRANSPYVRFCVPAVTAQGLNGAPCPDGTYNSTVTDAYAIGFDYHVVVLYNGGTTGAPICTIYDPSYGRPAASGSAPQAAELAYQNGSGATPVPAITYLLYAGTWFPYSQLQQTAATLYLKFRTSTAAFLSWENH